MHQDYFPHHSKVILVIESKRLVILKNHVEIYTIYGSKRREINEYIEKRGLIIPCLCNIFIHYIVNVAQDINRL